MERGKNRRNVRYLNCRSITEDEFRPRFSTIIKAVLETLCSVDKFGLLCTLAALTTRILKGNVTPTLSQAKPQERAQARGARGARSSHSLNKSGHGSPCSYASRTRSEGFKARYPSVIIISSVTHHA